MKMMTRLVIPLKWLGIGISVLGFLIWLIYAPSLVKAQVPQEVFLVQQGDTSTPTYTATFTVSPEPAASGSPAATQTVTPTFTGGPTASAQLTSTPTPSITPTFPIFPTSTLTPLSNIETLPGDVFTATLTFEGGATSTYLPLPTVTYLLPESPQGQSQLIIQHRQDSPDLPKRAGRGVKSLLKLLPLFLLGGVWLVLGLWFTFAHRRGD